MAKKAIYLILNEVPFLLGPRGLLDGGSSGHREFHFLPFHCPAVLLRGGEQNKTHETALQTIHKVLCRLVNLFTCLSTTFCELQALPRIRGQHLYRPSKLQMCFKWDENPWVLKILDITKY